MEQKGNLASLKELGLTAHEIRCYEILLSKGGLSAKDIASRMGILPHAVYRLAHKLHHEGFVTFVGKYPTEFHAVPASIAVSAGIQKRQEKLMGAEVFLPASSPSPTRMGFIKNRHDFYIAFAELAKLATNEILIISIGEPVLDEVKLAHRDALERGLSQKMIFHKNDSENAEILRSWVAMGIEVRHYPDWGFHLVCIDGKKSLLMANNPENPEERSGMEIHSEGLSKGLRDYFYSVWRKAKPIK